MGSEPVNLCHAGVCCFMTGIWGLEAPDLGVDPGPATLVLGSWVVMSVADPTHLATRVLCQLWARS